MVAYSFQKRFAEPILAGAKLHTIRADRRRHARPGEELQLYVGMWTKQCRLVTRKTCTAVLQIGLDFTSDRILVEGLNHPIESRVGASWNGEGFAIMGTLLTGRDLDRFAMMDGFSCFTEMRAFWFETHGVPAEHEIFVGKLIGWWSR